MGSTRARDAIFQQFERRYTDKGRLVQAWIDESQALFGRFVSAKGSIAYNLGHDQYFRDYILHLCPGYVFPNRKKVAQTLVPDYKNKLETEVNAKLQQAGAGTILIDGS
eukprot:417536_1